MSEKPSSSCAAGTGLRERRPAVRRLHDHDLRVEVEVDLPGGLVLVVQEVDVERPVGGNLRIRELVLVAVGAAAGLLERAARVRAGDLLRRRPRPAPVVRVAEPDRRLGVRAVGPVQEPRGREIGTAVMGRGRVVVDRQPLLVVEDGVRRRADARAVALEDRHRLTPLDAAVRRAADRDVPLRDERPALAAGVLELGHEDHPMLAVERRARVAGAVSDAERDLTVHPGVAAVLRGEKPRRDERLTGPGRVVEAVEVVVRPGNDVVRVHRVDGHGDLVVRVPVLVVRRGVAADVHEAGRRPVRGRIARAPELLDRGLRKLAARVCHTRAGPRSRILLLRSGPPLQRDQVGR